MNLQKWFYNTAQFNNQISHFGANLHFMDFSMKKVYSNGSLKCLSSIMHHVALKMCLYWFQNQHSSHFTQSSAHTNTEALFENDFVR